MLSANFAQLWQRLSFFFLSKSGKMNFISKKGLLDVASVFFQAKRFRGKINVQKPRIPHFERALLIQATQPYFLKDEARKKKELSCGHFYPRVYKKENEVNHLQDIYAEELLEKFKTSKMIAIYHKNPISAEIEFGAYSAFHKINMEYKVYGKETLAKAIKDTPYKTLLDFYVSHNALVFSTEPDIKKMLRINKKYPQLILLAAIYENKLLSKDDITKLSALGNIQTARAELVQTINTAAVQLVQMLDCNAQNLASLLQRRSNQLSDNSNKKENS